jgi:hypothetical protein
VKEFERIFPKKQETKDTKSDETKHEPTKGVDETKRQTSVVTHCFNSGTCTPMIAGRLLLFYSPFSPKLLLNAEKE